MARMEGQKMGQLMVICLMAMMSTSSSALGDARSIDDRRTPLSNEEDTNSPVKKAYTYVSEYKRLPVFNFGIGKRWTNVNGLKGPQPYSFGFGKRSNSPNIYPGRMSQDYMPYGKYNNWGDDDSSAEARDQIKRGGRIRHYDFGLGKRSLPAQFFPTNLADNHEDNEHGKNHLNDDYEQRFLYGLSNKFTDQDDVPEDD